MKPCSVIFMGTPDFAAAPLQKLIEEGYPVTAVFTQPDKPRGRSGKLQASPVKEVALAAGITVCTPARIRDTENVERIRQLAPDVIVVAAYGQVIPDTILTIPKYGCVNIHASLLPKYRGASPIQRAILDGEKKSGITIMRMSEGLDTGDILLQRAIELDPEETGGSLFDRLMGLGAQTIAEALPMLFAGALTPVPQPEISPTPYAAMLKKEDGRIDWTKDAVWIERMTRAFDPWPGAYTFLNGRQLKICRAAVEEAKEREALAAEDTALPGTVTKVCKDSFFVQTGQGRVRVTWLQPEGKKRMDCGAFLRGNALAAGTVLHSERE